MIYRIEYPNLEYPNMIYSPGYGHDALRYIGLRQRDSNLLQHADPIGQGKLSYLDLY